MPKVDQEPWEEDSEYQDPMAYSDNLDGLVWDVGDAASKVIAEAYREGYRAGFYSGEAKAKER